MFCPIDPSPSTPRSPATIMKSVSLNGRVSKTNILAVPSENPASPRPTPVTVMPKADGPTFSWYFVTPALLIEL